MKKNKFMKLASGLLVLCLMTTCVIGATLAKYTTASSSSDTARVAKWGVTVSASGTLFGKAYGANGAETDANSITATSTNVSAGVNVVAPGTKNETGLQLKLAGTPEVAYNVAVTTTGNKDIYLKAGTYGVMVEATGVNAATDVTELYTLTGGTYQKANAYVAGTPYYQLVDAVTLSSDYYPVKWTVNNGSTDTACANTGAVITALNALNGDRNANVASDATYKITWAWAFETGNDDAEKAKNNIADTILGNIGYATVVKVKDENYVEIETGDYSLDVALNVTVTVTQID